MSLEPNLPDFVKEDTPNLFKTRTPLVTWRLWRAGAYSCWGFCVQEATPQFDEFEALPPIFPVSNFDLHHLLVPREEPWVLILMRLSAIFTSSLEWMGDQEAKKDLNPFKTKSRVVSEKEAILPSGSSADLCSILSADPCSILSADPCSILSADPCSSSSADLRSSSSADQPLSSAADQPLSSAADQPLSCSAAVSLSSNCAHPLTLQGLQLQWKATTAKNDDKRRDTSSLVWTCPWPFYMEAGLVERLLL